MIIDKWRNGEIGSDEALKLIGKKMAKASEREIIRLQEMVNEIIGIPEELPEEGNENDRQNWERYRHGQ
jgi:hypothetical protein